MIMMMTMMMIIIVIKQLLRLKYEEQLLKTVRDEARQGKLYTAGWNDDNTSTKNCFSWLSEWTSCPTYVVAGINEIYQQLVPTKLYQVTKIKLSQSNNVPCRMCNKAPEMLSPRPKQVLGKAEQCVESVIF